MAVKDVTKLVERLEAFEERLGVRLESLSALLSTNDYDDSVSLAVRGELHSNSGTAIKHSIQLVVAAYDSASRVVGTGTEEIESTGFFGFEVFEIHAEVHVKNLTRIRIYPKQRDW